MKSILLLLLLTAPIVDAEANQGDGLKPPPGISSQLQGILGGALQPSKPTAPAVSTRFTPSGKSPFLDEMIAKLNANETQKEQFRTYATELIKQMEKVYEENGFEKNDLGVALGGLLEICYELNTDTFKIGSSNKEEEAENKKKTRAAVQQMQRALGSAPAFKTIPDSSKQMAYDACTFLIGHLAVTWQQAGPDKDKKQAVRTMARQQIQSIFKFDPDSITRIATGEFATGKAAETAPVAPTASVGSQGWKTEQQGDLTILTPSDLAEGEIFRVTVFPRRPLDKPIEEWTSAAITNDTGRIGKLKTAPNVKAQSGNMASGTAIITLPDGKEIAGVYTVISVDKETARLVRVEASTQGSTLSRHTEATGKLISGIVQADKKAAVASGRGLDMEKLPKTPRGMNPGGQIQPGIYAGSQLYGNDVSERYRLYLYPSGEYRMLNRKGEQVNSSVREGFQYDPRSGKLDLASGIQFKMMNNRTDPDDDLCLYGRDAENKPYVYARSNRGFNYATTVLKYEGPLDKPAPQEEREAKERAEAEAKRYKWVLPAGQGLKPAQIAGVLLDQQIKQGYNGSGLSVSSTYDLYLLLNDGTIYNGLPVPPDEMDVSVSRRKEPEKWGRWRKQGTAYAAAWPDAPNQFKPLKGDLVKPATKEQRLSGRFGTGESSGSIMSSSYRLWGVTFTQDGRFMKDNRGGTASNITYTTTTGAPFIASTYDDKGAITSASGENFVVSSETKKKANGNRSGTYEIDGYTIVLRFDNGKVVRQPFFFEDAKQKAVWFEGAILSRDKKD